MVQDWTEGYVADISYDYSFFPELAPVSIAFSLLDRGFLPPSLQQFTYCELGCGQGFSSNVLAATNPQGEFWAIDLNPTHIAEAQRLAQAAKLTNIHFFDQSFQEFLNTETPPFDFIALHGVYSWISDANRQAIVDLLRHKLNCGGAVYISYNTLPGWSTTMPLRELMVQYANYSSHSSLEKVDKAICFAKRFQSLKARHFLANPALKRDLDAIAEDSPTYLAHEYFNQNWRPLYHREVVELLAAAKLTFVTSADIEDQFYNFNLNPEQLKLLSEITDTTLKETIRDFLLNTSFRKDIFVKGPIKLPVLEQVELLRSIPFALVMSLTEIEYQIELAGRDIKLDKTIYQPLVTTLAHQPQTLKALMQQPALAPCDFASILQALKILMIAGAIAPALPEFELKNHQQHHQQRVADFNAAVLKRARFGADTQVLASPIIGSGIDMSRAEQLFLLAHLRKVDPVQFIWNILQVQGERLMKEDQVLESAEANQAELRQQAQQFTDIRLPFLQQLQLM
jgi:SAM-dependent methyltransferase